MTLCNKYLITAFFMLLSLPVMSHDSNKTDYDNVIIFTADGVFDEFSQARIIDPDGDFFIDRIGLDQQELENFIEEIENFYLTQFGLDFTQIPWQNGVKIIPGTAILEMRTFSDLLNYRVKLMSGKRVNFPLEAGGLFVTITGKNVIYHGLYGGDAGIPALPFDQLVSGYYWINRGEHHRPVILRFKQSNIPTHTTFEGWSLFFNDIESPIWGKGISDGAATIQPDIETGGFRSVIRNVITFPGRLPDVEIDHDDN